MAGKTTIPLTEEQYKAIITTMFNGVGTSIMPNPRIATALEVEANTGLRIGDIVSLRLCDIIRDGDRYRFDIKEQKTGKKRTFTVPDAVYNFLTEYCKTAGIRSTEVMFPLTVRAVQTRLQKICDYLGYEHIGTHSFRKRFATLAYENSGHDIELVRKLMQHSSASITSRYLGISDERMDSVLKGCVSII